MAITPSQTNVSDGAQSMQRLNDIKERRARAGRLNAGVAAASTSEMFKDQVRPSSQITFHSAKADRTLEVTRSY